MIASILFIPKHRHRPTETYWAIMLAAITDWRGKLWAVHRTYLAHDGKSKAPVEPAKMTLGAFEGHGVFLAPLAEKMVVAEGIETALSVQLATGIPSIAAVNAGNMKKLILPPLPLAAEVIICADNDENGCGQRAAYEAALRWQAEGRRVLVAIPPETDSDFNDVLRQVAP